MSEHPNHHALEPIVQPQLIPHTQLPQLRVLAPRVHRPLVPRLHHVHEAGPLHAVAGLPPDGEGLAAPLAHLDDRVTPLRVEGVGPHGVVVAHRLHAVLEDLKVAARLERRERLREEAVPVADGAEELAHVDEVEMVVGEGPHHVDVFDLEVAVGRDEGRLDGGEVCADYMRGGIEVGDFTGTMVIGLRQARRCLRGLHCPNPSARADIQDVLR